MQALLRPVSELENELKLSKEKIKVRAYPVYKTDVFKTRSMTSSPGSCEKLRRREGRVAQA